VIRDAFHQQGPFLGSGGRYSPGPATAPPLATMMQPLNDDLSSPWVLRRSSPVFCGEADSRLYLSLDALADGFTRQRPLRARPPFTRPCRSFWSAFDELIRGQTSPTDFCNCTTTCGQPNPDSRRSSQGRRPRPPSFSDASRPLPCGNGDARRAALRSFAKAPVLVLSHLRELAQP